MAFQTDHPVYSAIRQEIETACLPPGAPLKIKPIAARHYSSATPVREALIRLTSEDVVEFIPSRGFQVRVIPLEELVNHYKLMKLLHADALNALSGVSTGWLGDSLALRCGNGRHEEADPGEEPAAVEAKLGRLGSLLFNPQVDAVYQKSLLVTRPVRWATFQFKDVATDLSKHLAALQRYLSAGRLDEAKSAVLDHFSHQIAALPLIHEIYRRQII